MASFSIADTVIEPGAQAVVDLVAGAYPDGRPASVPVHVMHGATKGPTLFVTAAIHGDELVGIDVVRRVLRRIDPAALKGTLLAVPVVNVFGYLNRSRYLPDRRDLNRSFPGFEAGSLASRLADLLMREVIARSGYGIDLHSAAVRRTNLPQIRVSPDHETALKLAQAFGAPLLVPSAIRPGSLRQAAEDVGVETLVFEAGEGLRADRADTAAGTLGVLRVMEALEMIAPGQVPPPTAAPILSQGSGWVRAPMSGMIEPRVRCGDAVLEGEVLGCLHTPLGGEETPVIAPRTGVIIGALTMPTVYEGDALFHIAEVDDPAEAAAAARNAARDALEWVED